MFLAFPRQGMQERQWHLVFLAFWAGEWATLAAMHSSSGRGLGPTALPSALLREK